MLLLLPLTLILILILNFTTVTYSTLSKMILLNGEVTSTTIGRYETYTDWNFCLGKCYEEDDCMLVHQESSECRLYRFGSISSVSKFYGGYVIGVKSLETSCSLLPSFQINSHTKNNVTYITKTTSSSDTWNFSYSAMMCSNNTKLFVRGDTSVCIGVRVFENFIPGNYYNASALCRTVEFGMSLTGPANTEEYDFILATFRATPKLPNYSRVWLDGISLNATQVFEMEDDTHFGRTYYPFAPKEPSSKAPGSCLYAPVSSAYVDDIECERSTLIGSAKAVGAACRFRPEIDYNYRNF